MAAEVSKLYDLRDVITEQQKQPRAKRNKIIFSVLSSKIFNMLLENVNSEQKPQLVVGGFPS